MYAICLIIFCRWRKSDIPQSTIARHKNGTLFFVDYLVRSLSVIQMIGVLSAQQSVWEVGLFTGTNSWGHHRKISLGYKSYSLFWSWHYPNKDAFWTWTLNLNWIIQKTQYENLTNWWLWKLCWILLKSWLSCSAKTIIFFFKK